MTRRIELPGDNWAEIKEVDELTNRERKLIRRYLVPAVPIGAALRDKMRAADLDSIRENPADISPEVGERVAEALSADDLDQLDNVQSAMICAYTAKWSLERPLPTMETVDDLPGPIYDALAKETANFTDGSVDFGVDGVADPASPTVPSPV